MAFLRRCERMLDDSQPTRLDHSLLVAALSAQQSALAAVRPRFAAAPPGADGEPSDDPLIIVLLGAPGWRDAARAQRGCFSRAEAGRRINAP